MSRFTAEASRMTRRTKISERMLWPKALSLPVPTNPVYGVKITSMVVAVSELLENEVRKLGLFRLCYRGLHE